MYILYMYNKSNGSQDSRRRVLSFKDSSVLLNVIGEVFQITSTMTVVFRFCATHTTNKCKCAYLSPVILPNRNPSLKKMQKAYKVSINESVSSKTKKIFPRSRNTYVVLQLIN